MQAILTDDEAAAIWGGDTSSILNLEDNNAKVEPVKETAVDKDDEGSKTLPEVFTDEDITNALNGEVKVTDDEGGTSVEPLVKSESTEPNSEDLINVVKQLIEDETLKGFADDVEITTIDQVKELIKLNLAEKDEDAVDQWWDTKVSNYSPQIQAILHYAEQGGQDVSTLLNAIGQVEQVANIDISTEEGQAAVVDQMLKLKGFDEEDRRDQIELLKDTEKLEVKAKKFKPELDKMKEDQVTMMLQEEQTRKQDAMKASRAYLDTIKSTLDKGEIKGIKLDKDDKALIFESLALANHTSLSGNKTNNFVKTLEELQFGKNADYERFLEIVHFAVDPDGFWAKANAKVKAEVVGTTVLKLKSAKNTTPSSEETLETGGKKNTLSNKSTFRNPYK